MTIQAVNRHRWAWGLILVGLAVFEPNFAHAGYRVTYEAVEYSETEDTPDVVSHKNVMWIENGKLRTVNGDVEGFDLIADIKNSCIYVLDAKQQAFAQIDFVPVEDLDTVEETGVFQIEVEETAPPYLEYTVQRYKIYEDSSLIREITTTDELGLGFDFMRALDSLQRAFQDVTPEEEYRQLSHLFRQVRGVPLNDVQYYPMGKDILQAKKVERVKFTAEDFLPPKHYTKKTLRDLEQEGAVNDNPENSSPGQ